MTPALTSAGPDVAVRPGLRPCMVSYYFHPDYSGSSQQAMALCQRMLRLGAAPFIVAANLSGAPESDVVEGVRVFRLAVSKDPEWQIPSFWVSLVRFLLKRRRDYDVIHAHGTLQHGPASLVGRLTGAPTILKVAMAGSDLAFGRQGRVRGRLNRFMVHGFDRLVAITPEIFDEFLREGIDRARLILAPNGVDTAVFTPASDADRASLRRELGLPDGPILTFVGVLNARKNVDGILRIWARCVTDGVPGHLTVIGPSPDDDVGRAYRAMLDRLVVDLRLEGRLTFVGHQAAVSRWLRASDVFLFPSKQEGLPNSVLEAMSCGLACVVSHTSGMDHVIVSGRNGYICPLEDEEGASTVVSRLLSNSSIARDTGAEARATIASTYSLDHLSERYLRLYSELLASRRRGGA